MEVQPFHTFKLMDLYLLQPLTLGTTVGTATPWYVTHFMFRVFSPSNENQEELLHFRSNFLFFSDCNLFLAHQRQTTAGDWVLRQQRNRTIFLAPVWFALPCQGMLGAGGSPEDSPGLGLPGPGSRSLSHCHSQEQCSWGGVVAAPAPGIGHLLGNCLG